MPKTTEHIKINFSIDRGGTFTDVYAEWGDDQRLTMKLLSDDPNNYEDAPREGIRRCLHQITGINYPPDCIATEHIGWVRMGTTVATNALLERKGEPTALFITKGFGDLLAIGYQNRPHLFDLRIRKPEVLYAKVNEIDERVRPATRQEVAQGHYVRGTTGEAFHVLKEPQLDSVARQMRRVFEAGFRAVAIVLMHGYAYPEHERRLADLAFTIGFEQISTSSSVMPKQKIVPRGDTTVVDAYLTPHIKRYLSHFSRGFSPPLPAEQLLFMQSDGGLSRADHFRGSNAILSGPAGGVVGYARSIFDLEKKRPVIGFDMGGTSTDVSRFAGEFEFVHETEISGIRIQAPQLAINTVASGGGSRLFFKNGLFVAGPESAGAHPGPVCYRKNGYLTVTDANLFLGRLHPSFFPAIFGPDEKQPLDYDATKSAFENLSRKINTYLTKHGHQTMSLEEIAAGFIEVANQTMARSIREISVLRGFDTGEHILAPFGGAGGQHACAIARMLGIKKIVINRHSGILSAIGMGLADVVCDRQRPSACTYSNKNLATIKTVIEELKSEVKQILLDQGFHQDQLFLQPYLDLRYQDTNTNFMIQTSDGLNCREIFINEHAREFGFNLEGKAILVDNVRVRGVAKTTCSRQVSPEAAIESSANLPLAEVSCYFNHRWHKTPVYELTSLSAAFYQKGPCLITAGTSTVVVEPHCTVSLTTYGDLTIDVSPDVHTPQKITAYDPVRLSVFSNLFMSIAEQMGRTLQKTALSTNIKERLDFSCALFDHEGNLIANAPHIPVHLGSMSFAVQEQLRLRGDSLQPGDVLMTNHPAHGGTHLPDITVITPVWHQGQIIFFVASRGHHADIGGATPGSMPPFSKKLSEEGAAVDSFLLVRTDHFFEAELREILQHSRKIEDNIADLKAQIAANQKGIELLFGMVELYGLETIHAYMGYIRKNAENAVRSMLKEYAGIAGSQDVVNLHAEDRMDDGTPIVLQVTIDAYSGEACFDFTGTGSAVAANWNAPPAVTHSAILYALRTFISSDIPLNSGCLAPISIHIPPGSLLDPPADAAVVGGNVLTSQRIVDVIVKAFGAAASSQGCMNNLTFGNERFGYYETLGGGAGAGPDWHGQSAVHSHMTNTRITDPEILESRYPVLLKQFAIRKNSGGKGRFYGGDGLIRELVALETMSMAILSERRIYPPEGMAGGLPGKRGKNTLIRHQGKTRDIGGKYHTEMNPGDRLKIETPGGGGYGREGIIEGPQSKQHE